MDNEEIVEHCMLVAAQEEQQHLPCKNRCSVQRQMKTVYNKGKYI
jgi:hypothetical protein